MKNTSKRCVDTTKIKQGAETKQRYFPFKQREMVIDLRVLQEISLGETLKTI